MCAIYSVYFSAHAFSVHSAILLVLLYNNTAMNSWLKLHLYVVTITVCYILSWFFCTYCSQW